MESFSLPGYQVETLVGFGGSGEVWRAREVASGQQVALKRLHGGGGGAATPQQLRREAALLASVQHEHVVRLRSVVPTTEGGLVLVLDFAAGGSLASLLAVRATLTPGEVVTIGAPLAQALADVHARGLTHGDVTPANVLFDLTGKPMLADLGVARLAGEASVPAAATAGYADPAVLAGGRPSPASDVHGLAAVCYHALAGVAPYARGPSPEPLALLAPAVRGALVDAIESALDPDPRARPTPAAFARALYASCTPEAVRLVTLPSAPVTSEPTHVVAKPSRPPTTDDGTQTTSGRHRPRRLGRPALRRRVVVSLVAVGLLAGAVLAGLGWASRERPAAASAEQLDSASSPAATAPASTGDAEWVRVMTALDKARDQAFIDAQPDELTGVYAANSPALAADRKTLDEMTAAGEHAEGLALRLTSVTATATSPTAVELEVRDVLSAYGLVRADATVVHQAGRDGRSWRVTLRRAAAGAPWRIDTIAAG